jgi:hypothetical protein
MITLKHSVNLITEIDEHKMPDHLLSAILKMSEVELETMLRQTFSAALLGEGVLDKFNKGNSWATLKIGDN